MRATRRSVHATQLAPPRPTAGPPINDTPCTQEALVKPTPLPPSGTPSARQVGEGVQDNPCLLQAREAGTPLYQPALICPSGPGPTMPPGHVAAVPVDGFSKHMLLHGYSIPQRAGSASSYAAVLYTCRLIAPGDADAYQARVLAGPARVDKPDSRRLSLAPCRKSLPA